MLANLRIGWSLMAPCVAIHAAGLALIGHWLRALRIITSQISAVTWLFVRIAGWIIALHLLEISAWALLYDSTGAMSDLHSSLYFSSVTYTTTGYGDVVLPYDWRLIGGIEALTGILMCGWPTGFFFAIVSRVYSQSDTTR